MAEKKCFDDVCIWADSCALAGATAFFAAWQDAAVVVNGPMWCYYFALRTVEHGTSEATRRISCTQLDNDAIVFGAEDYLTETLQPYIADPPQLLAIVSSCAAGLIGDDVAGIARAVGINAPIVAVDSSGLAGSFAAGWQKAADATLKALLPEKKKKNPHGVNILGTTVGYCNGKNDAKEIVRLLQVAGYEVNTVLGCDTAVKSLQHLADAALNIVLHQELGKPSAKLLLEQYGTPFIAPLPPYGKEGTRRWLEKINCALSMPCKKEILEEIAHAEKEDFLRLNEIKSTWGELWFDEVLVRAPTSVAWGLARALRTEWADVRHLVVATDEEDIEDIADEVFLETQATEIVQFLAAMQNGLLLASSNEAAQVDPRHAQFLPITYPVLDRLSLTDTPFMGLYGARYVEDRIWNEHILRRQLLDS